MSVDQIFICFLVVVGAFVLFLLLLRRRIPERICQENMMPLAKPKNAANEKSKINRRVNARINRLGGSRSKKAAKSTDSRRVILFLGSNVDAAPMLDTEGDGYEIKRALCGSEKFKVIVKSFVRQNEIVPLITKHRPYILHIDGHGHLSGALAVAANIPPLGGHGTMLVEVEDLRDIMNAIKRHTHIAVFDFCHSFEHARNAVLSLDVAVGMKGDMGVHASRVFSRQFYSSLEQGYSIKESFDLAIGQLKMDDEKRFCNVPTLEHGASVDPQAIVFK